MKPKRSLALLRSLTLVVLLASPVSFTLAAENTSAAKPGDKFKLTWERIEIPEQRFVQEQWAIVNQRVKSGQASKQELAPIELQLERFERDRPYRFTLHSEGGTLRELLAALSRDKEVNLTLINAGEPSDLDLVLPPFDVRNANWNMIVEVLSNFVATRGLVLKFAGSDQPNPDISKSVFCVMRRADGQRPEEAAFESFQLAEYLDGKQTLDVIVEAVRAGWELNPAHDPAALRLKFHTPTKMLFVSGPPSATTVARQVLNSLRKSPVAH